MNCKEIQKLLQLYHDGELDSAKRSEIESHLAECQACQAELAELAALDDILRDGEAEKVPDPGKHYWNNFTHRVTRRLVAHDEPIIKRRRVQPLKFRLIPYLSAGLAVILALVVAIPFLKKVPTRFTEEETMSMEKSMSMHDLSIKQEQAPGFRRIGELDTSLLSDQEPGERKVEESYYEISSDAAKFKEVSALPTAPAESPGPPSGMGAADREENIVSGKSGSEEKNLPKTQAAKEAETGTNRGFFGIFSSKSRSADLPEATESQSETTGYAADDGANGRVDVEETTMEEGYVSSAEKEGTSLPRDVLIDKTAAKLAAKGDSERIVGGQVESIVGEKDFDESQPGYFDYKRQFIPRAESPQPGTLRVITDSTGQLLSVTIYQSCGDPDADTSAINAYRARWQNHVFRQRSAFYVPYSE